MDKIVLNGWYKIILKNGKRFTGRCDRIKNDVVFTFHIGESENDKITKLSKIVEIF